MEMFISLKKVCQNLGTILRVLISEKHLFPFQLKSLLTGSCSRIWTYTVTTELIIMVCSQLNLPGPVPWVQYQRKPGPSDHRLPKIHPLNKNKFFVWQYQEFVQSDKTKSAKTLFAAIKDNTTVLVYKLQDRCSRLGTHMVRFHMCCFKFQNT